MVICPCCFSLASSRLWPLLHNDMSLLTLRCGFAAKIMVWHVRHNKAQAAIFWNLQTSEVGCWGLQQYTKIWHSNTVFVFFVFDRGQVLKMLPFGRGFPEKYAWGIPCVTRINWFIGWMVPQYHVDLGGFWRLFCFLHRFCVDGSFWCESQEWLGVLETLRVRCGWVYNSVQYSFLLELEEEANLHETIEGLCGWSCDLCFPMDLERSSDAPVPLAHLYEGNPIKLHYALLQWCFWHVQTGQLYSRVDWR